MNIVTKDELDGGRSNGRGIVCGPIAEGETPLGAAARLNEMFGTSYNRCAFVLYKKVLVGKNQQFERIIGTVWVAD